MKRLSRKRRAAVVTLVLVVAGVAASFRLTAAAHNVAPEESLFYRGDAASGSAVHVRSSAWCGTDETATDRLPDAVGGPQIHVIYAYPSDGPDHFSTLAPAIASDLAAVDSWWRTQDPTRTLRFDLYAFPGCPPGLGRLDISSVRLSQPSTYYESVDTRAPALMSELGAMFGDQYKKYLVYYDGPVDEPRLCGQSVLAPDEGGSYAQSLVYAQACFADIGAGSLTASVAAHELGHNLGAVPPVGPPHACPGDSAHVCDDENDLMYPYTHGQGLGALVLDYGRDDYYGHSGNWWDLQDSPWLVHLNVPQVGLTVFVSGTGSGTVASDVPGISCPPACSVTWDQGSDVELTATPAAGTRFVGWSGGCSANPCDLTLSSTQTAVARFAEQDQATVAIKHTGRASGSVTSRPAGISCPGQCTATFDKGTRVQLIPTPGANAALAGWSGACSGKTACSFTAAAGSIVTATFGPAQAFVPPKLAPKCRRGQHSTKTKPCRR